MKDSRTPDKPQATLPLRYYLVERQVLGYEGDQMGTEDREEFEDRILTGLHLSQVSEMVVILGREIPLTIPTPHLRLGE